MGTHAGKEGVVKVGGTPAVVAEVQEWQIETSADISDNTTLNSAQSNGGWKSNRATLKSWQGSVSCLLDDTDTNGQDTMREGASIDLKVYIEGEDTGDTFFSGTAIITSVSRSGNLQDDVPFNVSFTGTGALTVGAVGS
jgi:predicted secreted protein